MSHRAKVLHGGPTPLVQRTSVRLRFEALGGGLSIMTATLTIDEAGQIVLPEALKRVFGVEPGVRLRAEVTADRIEIVKDIPVVTETTRSASGRLVLAPTGIAMDVAKAVREDHDEQAIRALRR